MSSNVISFGKDKSIVEEQEKQQQLNTVAMLEILLDTAKKGEIDSFVVIGFKPNSKEYFFANCLSETNSQFEFISAIEIYKILLANSVVKNLTQSTV